MSLTTNQRLDNLEKQIQRLEKLLEASLQTGGNANKEKWIQEAEAMKITGLKKHSLATLRLGGTFRYSTASGRKPKYWREDIDGWILKNSNVDPKEAK